MCFKFSFTISKYKYIACKLEINMEHKGSTLYQYFAAGSANIGAILIGISLGWSSPAILKFSSNTTINDSLSEIFPSEYPFSESECSKIASFITIGAVLGVALSYSSVDQYGRKNTLLLGSTIFIMGNIISILGNSVLYLYILRILYGIGVGILYNTLPLYIGEIAQDNLRSTLGSLTQCFLSIGYFYSFINVPASNVVWFAGFYILPGIMFLTMFGLFGIESPFFLMEFNETVAKNALQRLRGRINVMNELFAMKIIIENSRQRERMNCFQRLKTGYIRKCIYITAGLAMLQQLCGCMACIFYLSSILKESRCLIDINLGSIILAVFQILFCFISLICMKNMEYRLLLLLSIIILGFSHFFMGIMLYSTHFQWASFATLGVVLVSGSIGLGNITFILTSEIFRYDVKTFGVSIAAIVYWLFGLLATLSFLPFSRTFGMCTTFFMYSFMCLFTGIFVTYMVPDLNTKSFREIEFIIATWRNNSIAPRNFRNIHEAENRTPTGSGRTSSPNQVNNNSTEQNLNDFTSQQENPLENVLQRNVNVALNYENIYLDNTNNTSDISLGDWDRIWDSEGSNIDRAERSTRNLNMQNSNSDSHILNHGLTLLNNINHNRSNSSKTTHESSKSNKSTTTNIFSKTNFLGSNSNSSKSTQTLSEDKLKHNYRTQQDNYNHLNIMRSKTKSEGELKLNPELSQPHLHHKLYKSLHNLSQTKTEHKPETKVNDKQSNSSIKVRDNSKGSAENQLNKNNDNKEFEQLDGDYPHNNESIE